ncbi:MAG: DNA glycosylase, partial [Micrococcales bacterium]
GPDLLGLDWDLRVAVANVMAVPERSLGAALLDQRNLAGIGTFYLSETAFLRGVNPWRTVGELGTREVTEVITLAQRLMRANLTGAGQSTTGSTRRGHESYVHPRSGRSCRRCRTTIRVAMLGDPPLDRAVFFCPGCQPGPVPTDDGRPQRPLGSAPKRTRGDGRLRRPPGR